MYISYKLWLDRTVEISPFDSAAVFARILPYLERTMVVVVSLHYYA